MVVVGEKKEVEEVGHVGGSIDDRRRASCCG